jgi:hypothetical protein
VTESKLVVEVDGGITIYLNKLNWIAQRTELEQTPFQSYPILNDEVKMILTGSKVRN